MKRFDALFDGSNSHEIKGKTIADVFYLLAKLRDDKFYPKGGYSEDLQKEWDIMLDAWYGDTRPSF